MSDLPYDSILLVAFGGPERQEDVMPFLERVTRGRNVPRERLEAVALHYQSFGGKSPINDQSRALRAAIEAELRAQGIDLPVYWGNRNAAPLLDETIGQMRDDGRRRALAFLSSTFASYSGCRQYLENIEAARAEVGPDAPVVERLRSHFNHPLFIEAVAERAAAARAKLPAGLAEGARLVFTAHSIPLSMADTSDYVAELEDAAGLVASKLGHLPWQLVFQSRSGSPHVPWLEPDVLDHLDALSTIGTKAVVVVPIGFLSDHVEVLWDLDREAKARAESLGLAMERAGTVGTHPAFVAAIAELVGERLGRVDTRRALGRLGPKLVCCGPGCCAPPQRP